VAVGRARSHENSAADGRLTLPVEKKYLDENPVLVVQAPAGTTSWKLALAPPPPPPPAPPAAEPKPADAPAPVEPPAAAPMPTPTSTPAATGTTP
jgi:hypothetical protein